MTPVRFIYKGAVVNIHGSFIEVVVCKPISKRVAENFGENVIYRNNRCYVVNKKKINIDLDNTINSVIADLKSN